VTAPQFSIRRKALDIVRAHAQAEAPAECCGLLIGRGTAIDEAVPARNLADSPTRFLVDPQDHISVLRAARGRGFDVVGFFHSHPHSAAWPSPTDVAESAYPDAVHLIVDSEGQARLFRIDGGSVIELPFVATE
jgi:proteasome lid subunit RPN8/RPN11